MSFKCEIIFPKNKDKKALLITYELSFDYTDAKGNFLSFYGTEDIASITNGFFLGPTTDPKWDICELQIIPQTKSKIENAEAGQYIYVSLKEHIGIRTYECFFFYIEVMHPIPKDLAGLFICDDTECCGQNDNL